MSVWHYDVSMGMRTAAVAHLIADTPAELHAIAKRIGIQQRWYQTPPKASFLRRPRVPEVRPDGHVPRGAIDCDRNTFVEHLRRIRDSKAFGDLVAINREARR